jgi:hypothetical protein
MRWKEYLLWACVVWRQRGTVPGRVDWVTRVADRTAEVTRGGDGALVVLGEDSLAQK